MYANNPHLKSWIEVAENSDFPIQNIPFGIFTSKKNSTKRVATRIGDSVIDLYELSMAGLLSVSHDSDIFQSEFLNDTMIDKSFVRELRDDIAKIFEEGNTTLKDNSGTISKIISDIAECELHMPVRVGDYTDFYSSEQHAYNVGCMFRDPNNALLPNWKHIPVGYHGRASSIVVSGKSFKRPMGQTIPDPEKPPVFGPSRLLDFELEMGFVTFDGKPLGDRISTKEADEFIFGMCLFNDWSARDIQKWEYVPLGPFLGKNFASHISPWIVTLDALEPFRVSGPNQDPKVLPYLEYEGDKHIDINLEVSITPEESNDETVISNSNYRHMYWNMNQQLAHHTVNGCNIRRGDIMASGTISGNDESAYGSMLELSWKGTKPIQLNDGSERKFIQDGDTVTMRGHSIKDGVRVGFGEVYAKILPAE